MSHRKSKHEEFEHAEPELKTMSRKNTELLNDNRDLRTRMDRTQATALRLAELIKGAGVALPAELEQSIKAVAQ